MITQAARYIIAEPSKTRGMMSVEGPRSRNRVFEWFTSLALFSNGVLFVLEPRSISQSSFAPLLDVILPEVVAAIFLVTGFMRIAALWHNGAWPKAGPAIRIVGALIGAVAWGSMGFALLRQTVEVGRAMSPGFLLYVWLLLTEIFSAVRAADDVRARKP